jgi:hypothetical protein
VKSLPLTSAQSRSGGGGGIQKSGYDGSQSCADGWVVAAPAPPRRVVVVAGLGRRVVAVVTATVVVVADCSDRL